MQYDRCVQEKRDWKRDIGYFDSVEPNKKSVTAMYN